MHPAATFIFKVLIALKGRNPLILSPSHRAMDVSNRVGELVQQVLSEHGAALDLVQWVSAKKSRTTASALMVHPGVSFILATGGPGLVKAAYQSGKPAIGVGSGNAPVLVCADADLSLAASNIVMSKAFDNGLACCSENNLIVVESRMEAFTTALEKQRGSAVPHRCSGCGYPFSRSLISLPLLCSPLTGPARSWLYERASHLS